MSNQPYDNQTSQDERSDVLQNDRQQQGGTFHSLAQADLALERVGRHAVPSAVVVGSTSPSNYPKGPDWTVDPVGTEPNLGFDVNAMPPCGEPGEIAASIAAQDVPSSEFHSPLAQRAPGDPTALHQTSSSSDVQRVGSPPFLKKRS
jgi:hypothetical protein